MKKNLYGLYQWLLIINLLLVLFSKPIVYHSDSKFFLIIGSLLLLSGAIIDICWEIFWQKEFMSQHSKKIITKGIYSCIRHPLLLALILMFIGLAVFFNSLQSMVMSIFSVIIIFAGSKKEEKELIKRYGSRYKEYMKRVPYRFVPKII